MAAANRYDRVAIILHWVMAIAFLLMLASGLAMENLELEKSFKFKLYQWHKSLGVLLLCAAVLRLIWRFTHRAPALPEQFSKRDTLLAKAGHWALYLWMLTIPVSGWVMVSASVYGLPTIVFGWFEWPHIPGLAQNKEAASAAKLAHYYLTYSFMALIGIHVAAVIKHIIKDRVNLLPRMGIGKGN